MDWKSDAILLTYHEFGAQHWILEVFSQSNGLARGLVMRRGKSAPTWLTAKGGRIHVRWVARLADQLGKFYVEPTGGNRCALPSNALELTALSLVLTLLRQCPERHPYPHFFTYTCQAMVQLLPTTYARWELAYLQMMGFGLDITRCALTGQSENLTYISPHTGRAATQEAGHPWKDRLLRLPAFLRNAQEKNVSVDHLCEAFALTGHFLRMHEIIAPNHAFWKTRAYLEYLIAQKHFL